MFWKVASIPGARCLMGLSQTGKASNSCSESTPVPPSVAAHRQWLDRAALGGFGKDQDSPAPLSRPILADGLLCAAERCATKLGRSAAKDVLTWAGGIILLASCKERTGMLQAQAPHQTYQSTAGRRKEAEGHHSSHVGLALAPQGF